MTNPANSEHCGGHEIHGSDAPMASHYEFTLSYSRITPGSSQDGTNQHGFGHSSGTKTPIPLRGLGVNAHQSDLEVGAGELLCVQGGTASALGVTPPVPNTPIFTQQHGVLSADLNNGFFPSTAVDCTRPKPAQNLPALTAILGSFGPQLDI
ncbi:hypothetical protein Ancab_028278 [Ancistrocladus abbreviatus]